MPGREFSADELVVGNTYIVHSYERHDDRDDERVDQGYHTLTDRSDLFFHFELQKYDTIYQRPLKRSVIPRSTDPDDPEQPFYWRFFDTADDMKKRKAQRQALEELLPLPHVESKCVSEGYFDLPPVPPRGDLPPGPPRGSRRGGRKYTHRRTKIRRKNKTKTKTRMKYRKTRRIR